MSGLIARRGMMAKVADINVLDNEIWYWADNQVIPYLSTGIIYHTFANGIGVIGFNSSTTSTPVRLFRDQQSVTKIICGKNLIEFGDHFALSTSALTKCVFLGAVVKIGIQAMRNSSLIMDKLPESIKIIGSSCFEGCTGVTFTSIPSGIESIGNSAFYGTSVTISELPSTITVVPNSCFYNVKTIKTFTLHSGVTELGTNAFRSTSLATLTSLNPIPPSVGQYALPSQLKTIYVPSASVDVYKAASGWSTYADRIFAIPE